MDRLAGSGDLALFDPSTADLAPVAAAGLKAPQ
jgi:hypothetical protein